MDNFFYLIKFKNKKENTIMYGGIQNCSSEDMYSVVPFSAYATAKAKYNLIKQQIKENLHEGFLGHYKQYYMRVTDMDDIIIIKLKITYEEVVNDELN